jgi:hypothetical protein
MCICAFFLALFVFDHYYANPPHQTTVSAMEPIFQKNIANFTEVANTFAQQSIISSICHTGHLQFTVNGEPLPENAVSKIYTIFLNTYPEIGCIESENSGLLPTPSPGVYTHPPAVRIVMSYQNRPIEGFLYVIDLQSNSELDEKYVSTYAVLNRYVKTNWFKFVSK